MSRAARHQKWLLELADLEAIYATLLLRELRACAAGTWGLFGQNEGAKVLAGYRARILTGSVGDLLTRGAAIVALREKLVLEPFPLHAELLRYRAMRGPGKDTPGEPMLARRFLKDHAYLADLPESLPEDPVALKQKRSD
jgi:hypothetical protein